MTCHFSGTTRERWSYGKKRLKRWVLRRLRKMASGGADVTCCGRLFQIRGAATGKARSPTVDSRVRRTISDDVEAERRRHRASVSAVGRRNSIRHIENHHFFILMQFRLWRAAAFVSSPIHLLLSSLTIRQHIIHHRAYFHSLQQNNNRERLCM